MDISKKLENLWYYYKNYILVALVLLISLSIAIGSCVNKKDYDVNVLYITHEYADLTGQLDVLFSGFATDTNGDGEANAQVISISYGTTVKEAQTAGASRAANLAAGKNVLMLIDEQNYNELKAAGFLMDISDIGESEFLQGDRFDATASGMLSSIEGFSKTKSNYYVCIRTYDETRAKTDKVYKAQYDSAFALLKNIVDKY